MKKIRFMLAAFLALFVCTSACAADWDAFLQREANREKVNTVGSEIIAQLSCANMAEDINTLWKISCTDASPKERAEASVKLIAKLFPNGDPSKWEQVGGFFPKRACVPLQLAAIDAIYNAASALIEIPDGKYAAANIMTRFGKSSLGKIYFIDTMPQAFRHVIDFLLEEDLISGDWETSKFQGKLPLLPRFDGSRTREYVESHRLQYLDGACRVANNGNYAWDRDRGVVYEVVEEGDRDLFRMR